MSAVDRLTDALFEYDKANPWFSQTEEPDLDERDLGGPGSGNFGHAGRPGEAGGSAPSVHKGSRIQMNTSDGMQEFEVGKITKTHIELILAKDADRARADSIDPWMHGFERHTHSNFKKLFDKGDIKVLGGPGSGNFGHAGRPGEVGGSGGGFTADAVMHAHGLDPSAVDEIEAKILSESTTDAERTYAREMAVAHVWARESLKNGDSKSQNTNSDGVYTAERQQLHKDIAKKIFAEHEQKHGAPIPQGLEHPVVTFMSGMPGSGKSTAAQDLANSPNVISLDADHLKSYLPEYQDGIGTAAVVRESNDLADMFMAKAAERRMNIVIDGTMKTSGNPAPTLGDGAMGKMAQFKDMGYRVETRFVDIDANQSVQNAVTRFGESFTKTGLGRYVPPSVTRSMVDPTYGTQPRKSFELAKNTAYKGKPLIDAYVHVKGFTGDTPSTFGQLLDSKGTLTPQGGARE